MTEDRLREIEARANAATPGPWRVQDGCYLCGSLHVNGITPEDCPADSPDCEGDVATDVDLAFMSAAREDMPALVAEVRRLRAELSTSRMALDCTARAYVKAGLER